MIIKLCYLSTVNQNTSRRECLKLQWDWRHLRLTRFHGSVTLTQESDTLLDLKTYNGEADLSDIAKFSQIAVLIQRKVWAQESFRNQVASNRPGERSPE